MGLEIFITGLTVGLSEIGLQVGWVILVGEALRFGNLYLLYKLRAFDLDLSKGKLSLNDKARMVEE